MSGRGEEGRRETRVEKWEVVRRGASGEQKGTEKGKCKDRTKERKKGDEKGTRSR